MSKGNRTRAASGRRDRRQLPPLGLDSSDGTQSYYAALVDVHHNPNRDTEWSATIWGEASEPRQILRRTITGATIADLWRATHDELQGIGDEVNNIVGAKWMLDGDPIAWMELADRQQLDDVLVGVPSGLPSYRAWLGTDDDAVRQLSAPDSSDNTDRTEMYGARLAMQSPDPAHKVL